MYQTTINTYKNNKNALHTLYFSYCLYVTSYIYFYILQGPSSSDVQSAFPSW